MPRIHALNVLPRLPEALRPLESLAYDLSWSWHPEARRFFRELDPELWRRTNGNPVAVLARLGQRRLDLLCEDEAVLTRARDVLEALDRDRREARWFADRHGAAHGDLQVAYFSAEFGLTEALPIYSGGLGVLAGEHLKSAADLGVPLVGVGLVYTQGYFHQYLNEDGWQQEAPYDNDFTLLPLRRATTPAGAPASVGVTVEGRAVEVRVWEVAIGGVRLVLLDTNSPSNDPRDRAITSQLYGGGTELRFKQEIVLGMGGVRALRVLGLAPTVFHMNEGHSAFLALERVREAVRDLGLGFAEAREWTSLGNVFTTHTPVPAGFDVFSVEQLDRYLPDVHEGLGTNRRSFLALGAHEGDPELTRGFNMAYLALRSSAWVNGVSRLHAKVSRSMWQKLWPGLEADEVPIVPVTNGVHTRSWVSEDMGRLLDRATGGAWATRTAEPESWAGVRDVDPGELWATHVRGRERLVKWVRQRTGQPDALDPEALTIGFARRFATYKRATLLLRHPERLHGLLADPDRPVQFVFAGKAHPQDAPGKELIRQIVHFARDPAIRRRILFLEEYDIGVARHLVQGVDVWLNTPRRPKEASGTSGMKVVPNGGLNLSVLDGWWAEAFDGDNGWAIGAGEVYADVERGDAIEAALLLDLLEHQVVPEFYDREADGVPRRWVERMKASIAGLSARFSTDRMVADYTDSLYVRAHDAAKAAAADDHAAARAAAARLGRLEATWEGVRVGDVEVRGGPDVPLGDAVSITARVRLGDVSPDDVVVEALGGLLDGQGRILGGSRVVLSLVGPEGHGWYVFEGGWTPTDTGSTGCTVRIRPRLERDAPVRDLPARVWETEA